MNFTIFGVTETEITGPGFTSLTFCGASELRRPTLAERIMQRRARGDRRPGLRERLFGRDRPPFALAEPLVRAVRAVLDAEPTVTDLDWRYDAASARG